MPHSNRHSATNAERIDEPIQLARNQSVADQLVAGTNDDGADVWANGDHVHRMRKSAGYSAPLADGIASEPRVLSDDNASRSHDRTRLECGRIGGQSRPHASHAVTRRTETSV